MHTHVLLRKFKALHIENEYNNNYYEHACIYNPSENTVVKGYINNDEKNIP